LRLGIAVSEELFADVINIFACARTKNEQQVMDASRMGEGGGGSAVRVHTSQDCEGRIKQNRTRIYLAGFTGEPGGQDM
jgi:hypothetical protein